MAGIHELAPPDGSNPLKVDDHALAADTVPIEVIEASLFEADCHLIDIHVQISCLSYQSLLSSCRSILLFLALLVISLVILNISS